MKKSDVFAQKMQDARANKEGSFREVRNNSSVKDTPYSVAPHETAANATMKQDETLKNEQQQNLIKGMDRNQSENAPLTV